MDGVTGLFALVLAWVQCVYFVLTGIWPLLSIRTFMLVTGPKHDTWLVQTVGVLITAIGTAIGIAAWRGHLSPEIIALAMLSAIGLTGVDIVFVARGTIARIYLLDAAAEVVLLIAWAIALAL